MNETAPRPDVKRVCDVLAKFFPGKTITFRQPQPDVYAIAIHGLGYNADEPPQMVWRADDIGLPTDKQLNDLCKEFAAQVGVDLVARKRALREGEENEDE